MEGRDQGASCGAYSYSNLNDIGDHYIDLPPFWCNKGVPLIYINMPFKFYRRRSADFQKKWYIIIRTHWISITGSFFIADVIAVSRTETDSAGAGFRLYCRTDEGISTAVQDPERQSRCVREEGSNKHEYRGKRRQRHERGGG